MDESTIVWEIGNAKCQERQNWAVQGISYYSFVPSGEGSRWEGLGGPCEAIFIVHDGWTLEQSSLGRKHKHIRMMVIWASQGWVGG